MEVVVGVANPMATTCYSASALQVLFAVPTFTKYLASLTELCRDPSCPVCLLCSTLLTLSPSRMPVYLKNWKSWIESTARDFDEYQDAAEILRELIQTISTVPQHAPLSNGNPFNLATVENVTYVCPAACPAPQPTVRHLPEQMLPVSLPQCASASLEQVLSVYLEQEEVLVPGGLEVPTCACGLKRTRVLRRALSSLSDCLLLDVKRLLGGPATALETFLIVAGVKLEFTAATTRHGQHLLAHVRQGLVMYDDARVSQTPAWPTSVFSNCTVRLLRRVSAIPASPSTTKLRTRALAKDAQHLLALFAS